jgi:RNA polymerase sigma factor (sigma-70 family)
MWAVDIDQPLARAPSVPWTPRRLLPVSDDRLAHMVRSGHEAAFATLYTRYHQRLYRYCRSMLGNDNDAQDALQSTFAGAFAALAQGRRDAPVRPWLYRIAHNESISIMRRRRPGVEMDEDHMPPAASAAEVAEERGRLAGLMADLAELTERQRAALVMRELSGLSHGEIAAALSIDTPAAKQTIFEARRSLQEFAEGRAMVCDEVCRAISAGGGRTLRGRRIKAHLRDCRGCHAFAAAIPSRTRDLRAIAPPLAGSAAISILRRAIASTSSHGGGGGAGVAAGTAAKAGGIVTAGKALAGAAAVISVAAGATAVVPSLVPSPRPPAPAVAHPAARGLTGAPPVGTAPARAAALTQTRPAGHVTGRGHTHRPDALGVGVKSTPAVAHGSRDLTRGYDHAGGRTAAAGTSSQHADGRSAATQAPGQTRRQAGQKTARAQHASAASPASRARRAPASATSHGNRTAGHTSQAGKRSPASAAVPAGAGLSRVRAPLVSGTRPDSPRR